MVGAMKRILIWLLLLAALVAALFFGLRGPVTETSTAALKAYPIYSFVRTRNEMWAKASEAGESGVNRLVHRGELSGPKDRWITTPNNDTLYSSAFLDLSNGPVTLTIPDTAGRYASVAVMNSRTDNDFVLREGEAGEVTIEFGDGQTGALPPGSDGKPRYATSTKEAWLLVRVLVDGPEDLAAAQAVQQGFMLSGAQAAPQGTKGLAVLPDPASLLANANPQIAANLLLQDHALAATGYGGGANAFEKLPWWRKQLWEFLLPRIFERMRSEIGDVSKRAVGGWAQTPSDIGIAASADALRAGVALGGLGALPATEAIYFTSTDDSEGRKLEGDRRYRLTIPAEVPADSFWSLSIYERLPNGQHFYIENPIDRYAIGNRTTGIARNADGSITVLISPTDPGSGANWLPSNAGGKFALVFRAYRPGPEMLERRWQMPVTERLD